MGDMLRLGVFLTSLDDFGPMNEIFEEMLPRPSPARTTVFQWETELMPLAQAPDVLPTARQRD